MIERKEWVGVGAGSVGRMRVLLVSTYELGHQPLSLAVAAGALVGVGHEVRTVDLAVDRWSEADITGADAVAFSVPMHTATRLVADALGVVHRLRPNLPAAAFGLYATVCGEKFDRLMAGEWQEDLVDWASGVAAELDAGVDARAAVHVASAPRVTVSLGRNRATGAVPQRDGLPPLTRYARLAVHGEERLVGYVEASRGCAHRCRHCPVPVVYDGRTRLVAIKGLLADVGALVDAGAQHITFGDPDFLNAPLHAGAVVDQLHDRWPELTFDITVKVEHILRHRELLPGLAGAGCLFAVTAVESLDDETLVRLDKGHTAAGAAEAVHLLRAAGIEPRPTWLPFTPWTTVEGVAAIFDFVAQHDLVGNVDPVQYSVRLLVPPGSLLLEDADLVDRLDGYDGQRLSWTWRSPDPAVDALQAQLAELAETSSAQGWSTATAFSAMRDVVDRAVGREPAAALAGGSIEGRPRLTEPWFC